MKQKGLLFIFVFVLFEAKAQGDTIWLLEACMRYAVENSPKIKKQILTNTNYRYDEQTAVGAFFPLVSGNVGLQTNFGRSIDPETNTYSNTSNLSNSYQISGSMPVFKSGGLINTLKFRKIARLNGVLEKQRIADELSLITIQAYVDVVYYSKAIHVAQQKLDQSNYTLYKVKRMVDVGLKGSADISLIEAQVATDDYELVHMENLYELALNTLKEKMNYPFDQELIIDTTLICTRSDSASYVSDDAQGIYYTALKINPIVNQSEYQVKMNQLNKRIIMADLVPSLSLFGGVNSYYNKTLSGENVMAKFSPQFKNNLGQWIGVSLNIPIFDGLYKSSALRKARNNVKIAEYQHIETVRQLQNEIENAVLDKVGFAKEIFQMDKQVKADEVAYQVTLRKFEKGLLSALDLQTSSNKLTLSRIKLLEVQLKYFLKNKLVDYYKGVPLINEK